jgi:small-conductance mechanosensitive channel
MGVRGVIRDILSLYVGYKVLALHLSGKINDSLLVLCSFLLLAMAIWFLLERAGAM